MMWSQFPAKVLGLLHQIFLYFRFYSIIFPHWGPQTSHTISTCQWRWWCSNENAMTAVSICKRYLASSAIKQHLRSSDEADKLSEKLGINYNSSLQLRDMTAVKSSRMINKSSLGETQQRVKMIYNMLDPCRLSGPLNGPSPLPSM